MRTGIIVLALIPVVGFLANGLTYVSGEGDVGEAFQSVGNAHALADASRDFRIAVAAMRIAAKDFAASPYVTLVDAFDQSQNRANQSLDTIEASVSGMRADDIKALRAELNGLTKNFERLVTEQRTLGFSDIEGLPGELRDAGNKIERAINENVSWLAEAAAKKLMMALLMMRQHDAEYRLNRAELTRQQFHLR